MLQIYPELDPARLTQAMVEQPQGNQVTDAKFPSAEIVGCVHHSPLDFAFCYTKAKRQMCCT